RRRSCARALYQTSRAAGNPPPPAIRWTHGDPAYPIPGIDRADHGPNNRRMLAHVMSAAVLGVEAVLVRVEVDVVRGLPQYATVGLPDSAVRESRERGRSAIRSAGSACAHD